MTKRFIDYFDKDNNYIIQDLVNEDEYQVGFSNCDEDKFLELVNALAETSCDCITDCEIVMKKLKEENKLLKQSYKEFEDECQSTLNAMNIKQNDLYRKNFKLKEENEQLKSTIAQLIEQNRKNNELLLSDIRILEKALWCDGCANDYRRLNELRKEFMR